MKASPLRRRHWVAVRGAGIRFAFLRVSDGLQYEDPAFADYWSAAKAAGVATTGCSTTGDGGLLVATAALLLYRPRRRARG